VGTGRAIFSESRKNPLILRELRHLVCPFELFPHHIKLIPNKAVFEALYITRPTSAAASPCPRFYLGNWPGSSPCLPAAMTCISLPEDERLWKFERNWTEWGGRSTADVTGSATGGATGSFAENAPESASNIVVEAMEITAPLPPTDTQTATEGEMKTD